MSQKTANIRVKSHSNTDNHVARYPGKTTLYYQQQTCLQSLYVLMSPASLCSNQMSKCITNVALSDSCRATDCMLDRYTPNGKQYYVGRVFIRNIYIHDIRLSRDSHVTKGILISGEDDGGLLMLVTATCFLRTVCMAYHESMRPTYGSQMYLTLSQEGCLHVRLPPHSLTVPTIPCDIPPCLLACPFSLQSTLTITSIIISLQLVCHSPLLCCHGDCHIIHCTMSPL